MATKPPLIVITGANGFLGTSLVKHFHKLGWMIRALVHSPPKQPLANVTYISYNLDASIDVSIFKGVDFLVHAAYIKQDRQHPDAFRRNIAGAKRLLKAAEAHKIKQRIFISSMSAHKEAVSSYGQQKLAIEKLFSGPYDTNLRAGLIIGRGGIVQQMAGFMHSKHVVPVIDGGKQPLQIISVNDLARVIEQVLRKRLYGTYTVATPTVYTYKEFYKQLAHHLQTPVLFVPIPLTMLRKSLQLMSKLHVPLGLNEDNLLGLSMLKAVDTAADVKRIGVRLQSLDQALAQAGDLIEKHKDNY